MSILILLAIFVVILIAWGFSQPDKNTRVVTDDCETVQNKVANEPPEIPAEIMPLVKWICKEATISTGVKIWEDRLALKRVVDASEKAVRELQTQEKTEVNLPFIAVANDGPKHIAISVDRARCQELGVL